MLVTTGALAAADGMRSFAVEAGPAALRLREFGHQAQREILFPAEAVAGVQTHAVRGNLRPRDALDRMLDGSGLTFVEDAQTGALLILRAAAPTPPGPTLPRGTPNEPKPTEPGQPMTRKTPLALLGALLGLGTAGAQTAPAAAAAPTDRDVPIVLQEFRVDTTKDRGYLATNATTGTRLNMAIKDIPLPIEVITREFIADIGAQDIKEALEYSAGIVQDTVTAANNFTFSPSGSGNAGSVSRDSVSFTVRGLNTRSYLRSGFRQDAVTDTINLDRVEVARGPQALLYGVAALGGVVNITPRYPRATPQTDLKFGAGSFGFRRAEAYSTRNLWRSGDGAKSLNFGVGLVAQELSRAEELDDRRRLLVTPAFDLRLGRNTNVFVDLEYWQYRVEGNGFRDLSDASAGNVRNQFGLRVAENVDVFNGTLGVARDRFGRSRWFRWSGEDHFTEDRHFSGTVEVTHKLPWNLSLVAGANYTDVHTTRRQLSAGVQTANTASAAIAPTTPGVWTSVGPNPAVPGQNYWKTIQTSWTASPTNRRIKQTRLDLGYEFRVFGQKQGLLLGRTDQSNYSVTRNTTLASNNTYRAFDDLSRIRYAGEAIRPVNDGLFREWSTGHYAVYQGSLWRERIGIIAGWRNDRYMVRDLQYDFAKANPALPDSALENWVRSPTFNLTQANSAPGAVPKINGYRFGGSVQHEDGPTLGVNFKLNSAISVYVVSATGVFPNTGQRDGNGNAFNAERSESREAGVKFDLWKDRQGRARVSGTISAFTQERTNAIYNLFWAPQGRSNDRQRSRGFPTRLATGTGPGAYAVSSSGFNDFETSLPVTYLLPIGYVAAGDLNSPRVTGAPQQAGFLLVDYASLGPAASDPLRRAMDAAASDPANLTALQSGAVGTGATGLYANNPYAFNRNSDVAYNDEYRGFDAQIHLNLTDNFSAVINYAHLVQGVTGGFRLPDQAKSTEYDSWWNYMDIPLETRRANLVESSYDFSGQIKGARTSDAPRNQASIWPKYSFRDGRLRGLNASFGVTWSSQRQSQVAINNGARDLKKVENVRFRPDFPERYTLNAALGWEGRIAGRKWNLRFNVNNLLNDQKAVALGSSTLFINPVDGATVPSTTAGAQRITVPERVVRYFDPISFRLMAGVQF